MTPIALGRAQRHTFQPMTRAIVTTSTTDSTYTDTPHTFTFATTRHDYFFPRTTRPPVRPAAFFAARFSLWQLRVALPTLTHHFPLFRRRCFAMTTFVPS
jgi:hypothetical protein